MWRRRRPAVGAAPPPPPLQKLTLTKPVTQVHDKYMTFVTCHKPVSQVWLELVFAGGARGRGGRRLQHPIRLPKHLLFCCIVLYDV